MLKNTLSTLLLTFLVFGETVSAADYVRTDGAWWQSTPAPHRGRRNERRISR